MLIYVDIYIYINHYFLRLSWCFHEDVKHDSASHVPMGKKGKPMQMGQNSHHTFPKNGYIYSIT